MGASGQARKQTAVSRDYINGHYDAEGLCRELPGRLRALRDNGEGRLRK